VTNPSDGADDASGAGAAGSDGADDPRDERATFPVLERKASFRGRVWDVQTDVVALPGGEQVTRDVVLHPSAVAVMAIDDAGSVLLVRQYRHPVQGLLWELPAGLLDVDGEEPLPAAQRELWEETQHEAGRWSVLVDFLSSPGMADEAIRIYLARDVRRADGHAFDRHGEERDMEVAWFPLAVVRDQILAGRLHNPTLVVGTLAAVAAAAAGARPLRLESGPRPADAAWEFGPRAHRRSS
jgi:8-oxo-dGDP phosphatase